MHEFTLHSYEGPAGLRLQDAPEPTPGPGELLVRVEAAGLTLPLLRTLRGHGRAPLPHSPGGDLVGRVLAVGAGVTTHRPGDRVGGIAFSGVYAELALVRPEFVTAVAEDTPAADALAVIRSGLVALAALRTGALAPGESVLITSAAGGVGHLAVQLARALGAERVVAAVSSPAKADFLYGLGATEVVGYADLADTDVLDGLEPVDLLIDNAGGEPLAAAHAALAPFGRLVVNSGAGGTLDAGTLLRGMHTATGLAMSQLSRHRPDFVESCRTELWRHLATGALRPAVTAFPLTALPEAVALMERRENLGKVAVLPTAGPTAHA
ncbi:zinc-binding dehydrogenase [Kitasatospora sp. NA04385]|uniref:quinone oxidoreductase family protein n=1 Tax=Kitasatospora sp. NA04385 TaxID=2742135 RepID=UPI0015906576|nr:zinc-binding dehydrogenase [Kitasatospora sp. NA04385]QKW20953.1 zinc-binding dehydrogenase [Kitasatospora sp. NA04385]